jgi:hypothetical protein
MVSLYSIGGPTAWSGSQIASLCIEGGLTTWAHNLIAWACDLNAT